MATYYSTYQTAQRGIHARDVRPDRSALARHRRTATFQWTGTSGLTNGEYVVLGQLGIAGARIVTDQCKLRYTGSGTLDVKFTLQKIDSALSSATSLTAQTSTITAVTSPTSLAVTSGAGDLPSVAIDDYLILLLSTGASAVTVPATATVIVEVVYDAPGA